MQARQDTSWTARVLRRMRAFVLGPIDHDHDAGRHDIPLAAFAPIVPPIFASVVGPAAVDEAIVEIIQISALAPIMPPVVAVQTAEIVAGRVRHCVSPLALQLAATARLNVPVGRKPVAIGRVVNTAKPKPVAKAETKRSPSVRKVWLADRPVQVAQATAEIIQMPTQRHEPVTRPAADQQTVAA